MLDLRIKAELYEIYTARQSLCKQNIQISNLKNKITNLSLMATLYPYIIK